EKAAARRAHAEYFLALAETAEPQVRGAEQLVWLARLDAEQDNLRTALAWAPAAGEVRLGLRLAGALARYWALRGYLSEGRDWSERMLAASGGEADMAGRYDAERVAVLYAAAMM